jgi:hypothetical protein
MAGWDLASIADDVGFVRTLIAAERPGAAAYLGGASLGSIAALAAIDADPAAWDGAILWEGMLWSTDPAVRAMNQAYCAGLEAQLAGGIYFDGVGGGIAKQAGHLARVHPDGLTPMPLFPPFFTNHQVLVALFAEEAPGPVTLPVPGYRLMAGSLAADRFDHASEARLSEDLERFNNYSPTALVRDISCSLAGLETAYVDHLGDFTGAVLAIGGGLGFGPYMGDTLDLLGSDDVTFLLTPGFGHIDHFMTPNHRDYVERPLVDWLQAHR